MKTNQFSAVVSPEADVSTDQRNSIVPAVHRYREVKGSDDAHQTHRVPLLNQGMAWS